MDARAWLVVDPVVHRNGWIALLVIQPLLAAVPTGFFYWILAGGIIYAIGAVIHAARWPRVRAGAVPRLFGSHEICHLCVIAGSFAHYWAILAYARRSISAAHELPNGILYSSMCVRYLC